MKKTKLKNFAIVLAFPIGMFLIMELICAVGYSRHIFETSQDVIDFFRKSSVSILASYALLLNMENGRMDMSLGGQKLIGCLVGGNLALSLGFGSIGVLVMGTVFGMVSGLLTGLLYVTLRIPAMVLGIGVALVYEAISAAYAIDGFQLFGRSGVELLGNVWLITGIAIVVILLMLLLIGHTKFGLHYKAIGSAQRIAKNSGINIYKSAVICYALSGALIAASGILDTGFNGYMTTQLNLSSVSIAFSGFVPVFVALFLQRWCNTILGVPVAVIIFRILSMGLTVMSLPSSASTVITMSMLLFFLVFTGKLGDISYKKLVKQRYDAVNKSAA